MKNFPKYKYLLFIALISTSNRLVAQISNQTNAIRISEAEVQMQDKYMAAVVQFQIGKLENAAKSFQEVLEKNPKCDACAFQLARIYATTGDHQRATDFAKRAVALDATNKWYKMALAESLEKLGKDKEAADVYKTLAETNVFDTEYNREVFFRWVYCYVRMGDPMKAIKILEDLEKKSGIAEDITNKKVTIYDAIGDKKRAAFEIKKLADKYPQVLDYQSLASDYFMKIGDKIAANEYYQRILKIDPTNSKAILATTAHQKPITGGSGDDLAYFNSLKDLYKKSEIKIDDKIKTFLPYAQKIAEGKDKALAATGLELAQIIEQVHPTDAKSYAFLGDMLYYNGKTAEAIDKYKKCTQLNKTVYPVWEQMMYAQEELGLYADLLQSSEQAMDLFPNQATTFFFNGLANEKKGKLTDAVSSLEQAVLMSSKRTSLKHDALLELGVTHSKSKNYERADKAFDEALKLNNKSAIAMIKSAISFQQRGTADKAKALADEALKISLETDPSVLELYGDFLFKSNDKDGAVKYWTKAKERGSKSVGLDKKIAERNFLE